MLVQTIFRDEFLGASRFITRFGVLLRWSIGHQKCENLQNERPFFFLFISFAGCSRFMPGGASCSHFMPSDAWLCVTWCFHLLACHWRVGGGPSCGVVSCEREGVWVVMKMFLLAGSMPCASNSQTCISFVFTCCLRWSCLISPCVAYPLNGICVAG